MKESYVNLVSIRRSVFAEIAKLAYEDISLDHIEEASFNLIPGEVAQYRESVFRERAIIEERLRFSLGLEGRPYDRFTKVTEGIEEAETSERIFNRPLVQVISHACEACPERKHIVSDNCRKCLAHPCTNVCPVNAVRIRLNRADIDKEKCINCGRCKKTCPYNAIIDSPRPCSSVCGVDAIESDYLHRAKINPDKCVACGACIIQCPFGAIADKSQIYQLIKAIKSDKRVYAIIAPSFIGQFGVLTSPAQVFQGIRELGFEDVVEVSLGADYTTVNEAKEFIEKVPGELPFLATSCCYSWALMVEKNFPKEFEMISDSSSPMVYTAEHILKKDPEAVICFIGPCISKKLEAMKENVKDKVHFVITYEELMGMIVAKGIELSELKTDDTIDDASALGRGYAVSGGVAGSVADTIKRLDPNKEYNIERVCTLKECKKLMIQAKAGKKNGYLLEGMACEGGCIAGPGTLASVTRVRKALDEFTKKASVVSPLENPKIDK